MFAYFFDEDHPANVTIFGPQFAAKIIEPIEQMDPVPETRLLTGGLLHNMLVYEVESITLSGNKTFEEKSSLGAAERTQLSEPNYDRRLSIICDLAETLSETPSSFTESNILEHLAQKNIWVVVAPNLSAIQARIVHESIAGFGP
ncbi:MAG: hypothetical protein NTY59_15240 [Alphaproteobacteria bacterium]|nr:hypothetical protein [Alphaproteobacteria bacterium]